MKSYGIKLIYTLITYLGEDQGCMAQYHVAIALHISNIPVPCLGNHCPSAFFLVVVSKVSLHTCEVDRQHQFLQMAQSATANITCIHALYNLLSFIISSFISRPDILTSIDSKDN